MKEYEIGWLVLIGSNCQAHECSGNCFLPRDHKGNTIKNDKHQQENKLTIVIKFV